MNPEQTKPCTVCGIERPFSEFYAEPRAKSGLSGRCRQCKKAYRLANLERERASVNDWHRRNKERVRTYWSGWYAENREAQIAKATERYRRTYPENKARYLAAWHRRRARIEGAAVNDFKQADWTALKDYFGDRCAYCGRDGQLTQDHVVPLIAGGNHTMSNIVPACGSCNSSKRDRSLLGWLYAGVFREV